MPLFKQPLSTLLLIGVLALTVCNQAHSAPPARAEKTEIDLTTARAGFQTKIVAASFKGGDTPITPPKKVFNLIRYPAKDGAMAAYVTPNPNDGAKHPAVIWLNGGYGGIGNDDYFWAEHPRNNDQTGSAFRKAGIVTMIPSFRGEDDNPGRYEMFYGEIDDLESARAYLAELPYVDPDRIYLAGHSTGGTKALLASELSKKFRAVFSLGGIPDLKKRVEGRRMMVKVPFDQSNPQEFRLRSPGFFINSITTPTFYFEGEEAYWDEFDDIRRSAKQRKLPLHIYKLRGGDHFNIITPINEAIARKILVDSGVKTQIGFDASDIADIERNIPK